MQNKPIICFVGNTRSQKRCGGGATFGENSQKFSFFGGVSPLREDRHFEIFRGPQNLKQDPFGDVLAKNHTRRANLGSLPGILKIWVPLQNTKFETGSTGGLLGVYPDSRGLEGTC